MLDTLHFTLSDGVEILTLMGGILGVMKYFDGRRERAQKRADDEGVARKKEILDGQTIIKDDLAKINSNLDHRIGALEADARQFMPKSDLTQAFEHEKKNRITADDAAALLIKDLRFDLTQQGKDIAKLEQADLNHSESFKRIESRFDKTDSKIDKMSDCVTEIAKSVK